MTQKDIFSPWLDDRLKAAKTDEQRNEILREYEQEKALYSKLREERFLNAPSVSEKITTQFKRTRDMFLKIYKYIKTK